MARKATRKASASPAGKKAKSKPKKARASASRRGPAMAARDDDHLHEDNGICSCDVVFSDLDATPDADLPAARGGLTGEKYSARA